MFEKPPADPKLRAELDSKVERHLMGCLAQLREKLDLHANHFLVGMSQIACGADMLFTRACLHAMPQPIPQRIVLPQHRAAYFSAVGSDRTLDFTEEAYDLLIRAKTASLLSGACEVGALSAGTREREVLRRFGEAVGMAFQIVDDLLDYTEEEAVTGKPSGNDLREHKVTLPLIYALPRLSPEGRREVTALMATAEPTDIQIGRVIGLVGDAGGLEYARERANQLAEQADRELDDLPPSHAREILRDSITYMLDRRR